MCVPVPGFPGRECCSFQAGCARRWVCRAGRDAQAHSPALFTAARLNETLFPSQGCLGSGTISSCTWPMSAPWCTQDGSPVLHGLKDEVLDVGVMLALPWLWCSGTFSRFGML